MVRWGTNDVLGITGYILPSIYLIVTILRDHGYRAGSGVVRINPLHFLARCHKRRLNQALFVPSLNLGFF